MELRIRDSKGFVDTSFGTWLIPRIQARLISRISKYNFSAWDEFLTKDSSLSRLYKKTYKAADIILFASKNIVCTGVDGDITIHFNYTKFTPGFDRLPLNVIVKTINYGNISLKGCPIFTDTLNFFAEDIDSYIRIYYRIWG